MKKNFNRPVLNIEGNPFREGEKEILLKNVCVNALYAVDEKQKLSGEQHLKRHMLAKKIYNAEDEIEVAAEDVALLKECVAANFASLLAGPVLELLEG